MIKIAQSLLFLIIFMITLGFSQNAYAQDKNLVIRIAKLQIDSAQIENYKAALIEEIEASVRIEQGVLTLYAVSDKNNPTHITVFEIYTNQEAYKEHTETPHFKKYKTTTKEMVKSLELMDTVPIALKAKTNE
jgi:quinol monooxygenase YgiN